MNFTVTGADKKSGEDVQMSIAASTEAEAERLAAQKGLLVASVKPQADGEDSEAIELWGDDDAQPAGQGGPPAFPRQNADAQASASGQTIHPATARYHVIQNPALYLLETAVNKHMKDGWEPLGGIQVSMVNNQLNYYQALCRRPQEQAH